MKNIKNKIMENKNEYLKTFLPIGNTVDDYYFGRLTSVQARARISSLMGEKAESVSNGSAVKSSVSHGVRESNASDGDTTEVDKAFVANRSEKIINDESFICHPNDESATSEPITRINWQGKIYVLDETESL